MVHPPSCITFCHAPSWVLQCDCAQSNSCQAWVSWLRHTLLCIPFSGEKPEPPPARPDQLRLSAEPNSEDHTTPSGDEGAPRRSALLSSQCSGSLLGLSIARLWDHHLRQCLWKPSCEHCFQCTYIPLLCAGKRQRLAPDRDYAAIAATNLAAQGAKKGPMLEEAAMALLLLDNGKVRQSCDC